MIAIVIGFSIIYIALITFIAKTYYSNIRELEKRILVLEKRIEKNHHDMLTLDTNNSQEYLALLKHVQDQEKRIKKLEKEINKCKKDA